MRRRALLTGAVGLGAAVLGRAVPTAADPTAADPTAAPHLPPAPMPPIRRRDEWADAPPAGPLLDEDDVRFVLVHHTASGNSYAAGDVPGILRGIRAFHTGPQKRWPDIAYNFVVDRYGVIWEARAGSADRAVRGDATGGSQGFAVLACVLGDLDATPPTEAARQALVDLLAWQLGRHGIDPQATTTFTSRGSNRHPAGAVVATPTIAGHRAMSLTACPGGHGMALVADLPALVAAVSPQGHFRRG